MSLVCTKHKAVARPLAEGEVSPPPPPPPAGGKKKAGLELGENNVFMHVMKTFSNNLISTTDIQFIRIPFTT